MANPEVTTSGSLAERGCTAPSIAGYELSSAMVLPSWCCNSVHRQFSRHSPTARLYGLEVAALLEATFLAAFPELLEARSVSSSSSGIIIIDIIMLSANLEDQHSSLTSH